MDWSDKSVVNSFVAWLAVLLLVYVAYYPLYYVVALGYILFGASSILFDPDVWKEKTVKRSALGFTAAVVVTLLVFMNHFGPVKWWSH